jgi:methylmalonyl-CoA mutase
MTPEFGAASQLEKIDMLDFADLFAINKFDRQGGEDALRDVSKQVQRNRGAFDRAPESMPVFGTIASKFNDDGITALYQALVETLRQHGLREYSHRLQRVDTRVSTSRTVIIPAQHKRYLAEIAEAVREYHRDVEAQATLARERQQLTAARAMLAETGADASGLDALIGKREQAIDARALKLLETWPEVRRGYEGNELVFKVRGRELKTSLKRRTLSGTEIPRVSLPRFHDHGDLLSWLLRENLPGRFPFTGGVFQF